MLTHKFLLPQSKVYLCGHSLGPLPALAKDKISEVLHDFEMLGAHAWNEKWLGLPQILEEKIGSLIGAQPSEVIVGDSTVVNLYKVLKSAMKLQKDRRTILTTFDNFPADLYIAQGIAAFDDTIVVKTVPTDELLDHINDTIALVLLTHTNYRTAGVFDMPAICEYARQFGVLTVWDLSHSVGMIPLNLERSGADFAVGCTYKYLSGGPGSPAFIYANKKKHQHLCSPIFGWMGHDKSFDFAPIYSSFGMNCYRGGTPPILSLTGLEASLELFNSDLIEKLHLEALRYGTFLAKALEKFGIEIILPQQRGGHIALLHPNAYQISRALLERGIICDYRNPSLIRLCVNPLYLRLEDIEFCIEQFKSILRNLKVMV